MAKYIFLNIAAYGHVNPTLALVRELVRRGQQVSYYLTEEFREAVEATGATFQTFHPYESSARSDMPPPVQIETAEEAHLVPPQIIDRIRAEQPDVIIHDYMCVWAREVIEAIQLPAITTRATYASNERFNFFKSGQENL